MDFQQVLFRRWCSVIAFAAVFASGCSSQWSQTELAQPGFMFSPVGTPTYSALRVGDRFPAIEGVDLNGSPISFDPGQDGGRYTLIVFWTSTCHFCVNELPEQVELADKHKSAGLRVIGINGDESIDAAREVAKKYGLPWPNIADGGQGDIVTRLAIEQWPTLFLLDADGRVVMATPELRAISVESLPDGTDRQINALEWTLRELLDSK